MPHRKQPLVNNEIYHIVARRIEDKLLFNNIDDYYRGIFSIYEFNNANPVEIAVRRHRIKLMKEKIKGTIEATGDPTSFTFPDERDKLVEVLAFCFMPNHIHLLLRQIKNDGITKFMKKFGTGYAGYFKQKYALRRRGYFFQDRFTSICIKDDNQLKVVFIYIHANPMSLTEPKWKERGIKNPDKVIKFLESYKWSSYQDYIGKRNFPSVTERDFILKEMGNEQGCRDFIEDWAKYKGEIKEFPEIALEK